MAASVSRGRRVLGEKDRNMMVGVGVDVDINNKAGRSLSKPGVGDAGKATATATSSPKTGQKRKFDLVEEDGGSDGSQQSSNSSITQPLSTLTSLSDAIASCPEYETAEETSLLDVSVSNSQADDVLLSTLDASLSSQPRHSQGEAGADPPDSYFEIHEEMSQQTLDKLHAVSLSQPQQQPNILLNPLLALPCPSLAKENSQTSVSMSSLIGFDEKDGSQEESGEEATRQQRMTEQHQEDQTTNAFYRTGGADKEKEEEDGSRHAATVAEKAQTLRTRLQLAYYKVTTNQASTPFSRLAAQQQQRRRQGQASSSSSGRSRLLSPPQLLPAYHGRNNHRYGDRAEWRMAAAAARERAAIRQHQHQHQHQKKKAGIRSLHHSEMPPSIRPTEVLGGGGGGGREGGSSLAALPTTPIQANRRRGVEENGDEGEAEKEGKDWDSEKYKDGYDDDNDNDNDDNGRFAGLTSSVVKGEAADLLLQLNRASATPGRAQG